MGEDERLREGDIWRVAPIRQKRQSAPMAHMRTPPALTAHGFVRRVLTRRRRGVTLVELVVTMAVMAILASLAAPSFNRMIATNRMATQTNEFVMNLNAAKSEALKRGSPVTLRAGDNSYPNDFHRGWVVFSETDSTSGDGVADSDSVTIREQAASTGATTIRRVTRSSSTPFSYAAATASLNSRQFVTFTSRGTTTAGGSAFFRICDSANAAIRGRIIQVWPTGRVSLDSTNENCTS